MVVPPPLARFATIRRTIGLDPHYNTALTGQGIDTTVRARNGVALAALWLAGCGDPPATELPVQPVGDMRETMTWVLDPAADAIWGATGYVITAEGEEDLTPTTEEGWAAVRHGAAVIAEGGNLLLMPHLMPVGEPGPALWIEYSHGMTRIAEQAIEAVDNRDSEALFEIGGHLYNVCVACHQVYARMPTDDAGTG